MSDNQKDIIVETGTELTGTEAGTNANQKKSSSKEEDREKKERARAQRITGRTRFIATVPATGLLIAAIVLAVGTIISLVFSSYEFVIGEISLHDVTIEYVEYADSFLLAVALYILSIGLTNLFISDNIPLPEWLAFHDFDDLKERLTSVIIVMIGVYFLGYVLKNAQGIDTLWIGLGCAAIIVALSVFLRSVFKSDE